MAKNTKVKQLRLQKFKRRRGPFRPGSDPSTMDKDYLAQEREMRKFWGENVRVKQGTGPKGKVQHTRGTNIPDDARGTFQGHGGFRPVHREDNSTPATLFHLHQIFPGARLVSKEREAVLDALRTLRLTSTMPEYHIVKWRTKTTSLRLYFTVDKKQWWFVLQVNTTIHESVVFNSKEDAEVAQECDCIPYDVTRTIPFDSS